MSECIFCQISQHKSPAKIEYEDKEIIAFWDIKPTARIHILVIPKKHISSLNEVKEKDRNLVCKLIWIAQKLAEEKQISKSGYRIFMNTGPWSGQIVQHLHLHLVGG